ncbi:MAG: hypothetical protein IJ055_01025 [Oscillospiraceae bacterium]|nr:hypothetical protein [Oscillospiraceae bacterium]
MQDDILQEQSGKIIDVVEDFVCPQQTDGYRTAFRNWRRRRGNPYALCFTRNPKESSFSEDRTAVKETPAHAEQAVLGRLGYLIGFALLMYPFVEYVLQWVTVTVLQATGAHIEMVFWDAVSCSATSRRCSGWRPCCMCSNTACRRWRSP